MLIISDREDGSRKLIRALGMLGPCQGVGLGDGDIDMGTVRAIISDVSLDRKGEVDRLRSTVEQLGGDRLPLLCLMRGGSRRDRMQAFDIGACEALPYDMPASEIVERVQLAIQRFDKTPPDSQSQVAARKAALTLADMLDIVGENAAIQPRMLVKGADLVLAAVENEGFRSWLDVVQGHDDHTYQHCLLVAGLAAGFAFELGFNLRDRRRLTKAALLHDIGKALIPLELLNKPGRLTEEEFAVVRTHVTLGHDYLVGNGRFAPELLHVVRHHHEYLDGSGYPDGLVAAQIPDLVRLVTICDIYAALIESRAYKKPMVPAAAYQILLDMEGKLDRHLLVAFRAVIRRSSE